MLKRGEYMKKSRRVIIIPLGKTASLSLSINAIVVLILAITMLGLGLAFMKGLFGKTTKQLSEVGSEIEAKVIEDIQKSGMKLTFLKKEVTLKRSEQTKIYFGVKNQLNIPMKFKFGVDCYDALGVSGPSKQTNIDNFVKFDYPTDTIKEVPVGDVKVMAVIVKADPNAQITTYTCEIASSKGEKSEGGAQPALSQTGIEIKPISDEYAREQFFVTVE